MPTDSTRKFLQQYSFSYFRCTATNLYYSFSLLIFDILSIIVLPRDMGNLALFGYNSRGFSFEVEQTCRELKLPVQCGVTFNDLNVVVAMGSFNRKTMFMPDADIAGIGIFVTLLIQAFFIFLLASIIFTVYNPGKKTNDWPYRLLFSVSDISTILAIVYILNFLANGKCTMSTYHYYVALDSVLLSCSTMVVTITATRHLYLKTAAGLLRFMVTTAVFIFLGIFLGYLMYTHWNTDFPEFIPPDLKTRKDSAILLPVSCFFDPDLVTKKNPYSPDLKSPLSLAELDRIGSPIKNYSLPEIWIYVSLALIFLTETLAACCSCWVARSQNYNPAKRRTKRRSNSFPYLRVLGLVTFSACLCTDIFCAWHIYSLRKWVSQSGWMKNNSEDEWFSVSQLMPILSLSSVVFFFFGEYKDLRRILKSSKGL